MSDGGRVPPHSLETERAVIASWFFDTSTFAAHPVEPTAFFSRANGVIAAAIGRLVARGAPPTFETVRTELVEHRELHLAGGDDHLLALTGSVPNLAATAENAAKLREYAAVRASIEAAIGAVNAAYEHDLDRAEAKLTAAYAHLRSTTEPVAAPRVWRTPHARALALGLRGEKMPTGIHTLDVATRGGPRSGRVIVLGGAPGAGKTSLVLQLARHYHDAGHAVAVLAADEDADGLLIRWGQQEGIAREDLEGGAEHARLALADAVDSDRLHLVDQDEEDAPLELVVERLAATAAATERPGVLVIDSVQTVRTMVGDAADTPRARIDAAITIVKAAAKVHGFLVLATSEMARGYYRGGGAPGTEALASFKESGGIEYGAAIALALTSVQGEADLVDVAMPKNRMGERLTFRLRLDRARAHLEEVEAPDEGERADERAAARDAARDSKIDALGNDIVLALVRAPAPITGQRGLRELVRGRASDIQAAIARLIARGRIVGGGREPYRAVSQAIREVA